jgi:hypothetical protein
VAPPRAGATAQSESSGNPREASTLQRFQQNLPGAPGSRPLASGAPFAPGGGLAPITITKTTTSRLGMTNPGAFLLRAQRNQGCCAAAPGSPTPGTAARPTGSGTTRAAAATSSVSASAVSSQDILDPLGAQALGPFNFFG